MPSKFGNNTLFLRVQLSKNLFAYCTNDPVNHSDDTGLWKLPNWAKIGGGVAAIDIAVAVTPVLISALVATGSSAAIGAAVKGIKVLKIGRMTPTNKTERFLGVLYKDERNSLKSIEIHPPHESGLHYIWHYPKNKWNPRNMSVSSKGAKRWTMTFKRF